MLIELLQKDARTPQHELARIVGLAASSVNERIRKLGERGLIAGYHARISPDVFGYDLLAFVYVGWSRPETEKAFLKKVLEQSTVMEIHHVTGTWNYMLTGARQKHHACWKACSPRSSSRSPASSAPRPSSVLSSLKETAQIPTREPSGCGRDETPTAGSRIFRFTFQQPNHPSLPPRQAQAFAQGSVSDEAIHSSSSQARWIASLRSQ